LASTGPGFDKAYVIERCVTMKRDVVARDEFDTGERRLLNLGHTVGHGVEAKSNFTLSHGKSVAIGTAIIARSAVNYQLLSQECAIKIENLLREFCLPVRTQDSAKELASFALSDKKRTGDTVSLVVPRAIGRCEILTTPVEELEKFIQAGL
ncbi:MAG: 3-dehydroquinate synthase, partial [Candidatus Faecousia sp.]|nr:3-dehydroquinate synthase [Candidatus Faecousia sp.]